MKELLPLIQSNAKAFGLDWQSVAAFVEVETGGKGFADNGKIIIQFEPAWFKRKSPYTPSGKWSLNGVDVQVKEWEAFNDAFAKNADAAMQSTSIGLGQILGLHYERLGYDSVGEMWDDAKKGLERQVWQICKFIATDKHLDYAVRNKQWYSVALFYNGAGFVKLANRIGREPYNISLEKAYNKYK